MAEPQAALLTVLDKGQVDLRTVVGDLGPVGAIAVLDDVALDQLVRAFESVLVEALRGGREQRDLVLQTTVPAVVAQGQGILEVVEAQAAIFVAVGAALVGAVPAADRAAVREWLAHYAGGYVREVAELALAAQRDGTA